MDISTFWQLIDTTREASGGNHDRHSELLIEALIDHSIEDILSFDDIANDLTIEPISRYCGMQHG